MLFWEGVGKYLQISFRWFTFPITLGDFTFTVWQISVFFFILDLLLNFIGFKLVQEENYRNMNRNKPYETKEVKKGYSNHDGKWHNYA